MPLPNHFINKLKESVSETVGDGFYDSVWLSSDACLTQICSTYRSDCIAPIELDGLTRFSFIMSCDVTMAFDGITTVNAFGPACQVLHHPVGVRETECFRANKLQHWVMVCFNNTFLIERFGLTPENAPKLLQGLVNEKPHDFLVEHLPLQLEMRRCLTEMRQSDFQGNLRQSYIEAKGIELICLLIEQLCIADKSYLPALKLKARDKEVLDEVKRILDTEFIYPPSATELAARLGSNRNKLTCGFRLLMGQTMSDYCRDLRLNLAMKYLRDTDKPIAYIAQAVGYTSASSFSVAFNRQFSMSARQVRAGALQKYL